MRESEEWSAEPESESESGGQNSGSVGRNESEQQDVMAQMERREDFLPIMAKAEGKAFYEHIQGEITQDNQRLYVKWRDYLFDVIENRGHLCVYYDRNSEIEVPVLASHFEVLLANNEQGLDVELLIGDRDFVYMTKTLISDAQTELGVGVLKAIPPSAYNRFFSRDAYLAEDLYISGDKYLLRWTDLKVEWFGRDGQGVPYVRVIQPDFRGIIFLRGLIVNLANVGFTFERIDYLRVKAVRNNTVYGIMPYDRSFIVNEQWRQ